MPVKITALRLGARIQSRLRYTVYRTVTLRSAVGVELQRAQWHRVADVTTDTKLRADFLLRLQVRFSDDKRDTCAAAETAAFSYTFLAGTHQPPP